MLLWLERRVDEMRQRKERAEAERISQLAGQWEAAEVERAIARRAR